MFSSSLDTAQVFTASTTAPSPPVSVTAPPIAQSLDDFLPISVNTLVPNECVSVDLYIQNSDGRVQLYRDADVPFGEKDLQRLLSADVRTLYIRQSAHEQYQEYLRENLTATISDESRSVSARFWMLNEVVRDVLASTLRKGDIDEVVSQSRWLADHSVELLSRDDYSAADLIGVLKHDYQTFTHSANVSFLCVMLAKKLGIHDAAEIHEIAVGGLLHDLGKLEIPVRVLNKPGPLTDVEFDSIKKHPRWGFEKLCRRDDITFGQLMMVYQHHERVAGEGYPVGCPGREIHEWARLCAVVDVYEALTANRPYRAPYGSRDVVEIMSRGSGMHFDEEMLTCWLTIIRPS